MSDPIEWMPVKNNDGKKIGAIGWMGDTPVVVVPLYDVADDNKDGSVSMTEKAMWAINPFTTSTSALEVVENARGGYLVTDIANQTNGNYSPKRHSALRKLRAETWMSTGGSLIKEAIWKCSLQRGVGSLGGALGRQLSKSMLGQVAIKKGFSKAIKAAFDEMLSETET